jgi:predicted metal-dependent phosphotriesterase family hydrolase
LPAEVLRIFAQCLMEKGVTQEELDVMMKENPRLLLGIQ